jgi:hypothetical protein
MNTILDIMGATIVGGIVLMLLIKLNVTTGQARYSSDTDLQVQGNAKTLADIIDNDLRKIGYKYGSGAITEADSNKITFYSDIDNNWSVNKVTLCSSDAGADHASSNPHNRILYRVVDNDTSKGPSLGLTRLKFTYMNLDGKVTTTLDSIKYIKAEIWIESGVQVTYQNKPEYLTSFWEVTVNPRNL